MSSRVTRLVADVATSDPMRRMRARARRTLRLPGSTIARPDPSDPEPIPDFRLFAMLGTWMEADVIDACVRNAFAQGCDEVFLVDNASTDETVEVAQRAGATLAVSFSSESYNESMRIGIMNEAVREISQRAGDEHIWWLWLDADEFPQGPGGATIREYLESLDRQFRCVGARFFNHFPSSVPAYIPGRHPIDDMPWCEELPADLCGNSLNHFKHPLQRFDRSGPPLVSGVGAHSVSCRRAGLFEPRDSLLVHHFNYREEHATRARMELLCGNDAGSDTRVSYQDGRNREAFGAGLGMVRRLRRLDEIYARAREGIDAFPAGLRRWDDLAGSGETNIPRWY
jgi:hypothetical protein